MKRNATFSVLIPCYNCEKTIVRCLQSVLMQTYTNYKIYVIDDCSTDNSYSILKKYYDDGKIYYLKRRQKNLGSVVGRKQLISLANQDYCLFIDNDDQFTQNCFQTYVDIINDYPLDIVATDFQVKKTNQKFGFLPSTMDNQIVVTKGVFDYSFFVYHYFLLWNKAIKTAVAKMIKIPDVVIYGCDDHMFSLQLYLNAKTYGMFRTQNNYIYHLGEGQWGHQMDELTMRRFCVGYANTLLYNFQLVNLFNLDKKYFNLVYRRYGPEYLKVLANNEEKLLNIYNSFFNRDFYLKIKSLMNVRG